MIVYGQFIAQTVKYNDQPSAGFLKDSYKMWICCVYWDYFLQWIDTSCFFNNDSKQQSCSSQLCVCCSSISEQQWGGRWSLKLQKSEEWEKQANCSSFNPQGGIKHWSQVCSRMALYGSVLFGRQQASWWQRLMGHVVTECFCCVVCFI